MNNEDTPVNELDQIQRWYKTHCDGDWEHQFGVQIGTLDNPGWYLDIDLEGTDLANRHFDSVSIDRTESDWLRCTTEGSVFKGRGGPANLRELLGLFLVWAASDLEPDLSVRRSTS